MPKDPRIKKVLVIGSGPIIIGQAAEFDYSGTQACRALKAEGIETVLLNSNPATIMTDPDVADHVYIEPMTLEVVERILDIEKPDSVLPNLGGQMGLNLSMELARSGYLDRTGIRLLACKPETIDRAEDRELFKETMEKLHQPIIPSEVVETLQDALACADRIGYPVIVRPAFTMGGTGGGICQVSTTLYVAVLKAELEVTERYSHSMIVHYVDPSMDAAIAEGLKDLKFINNTDAPIYIEASADGSTLHFAIYGHETRDPNRTVRYESETTSTEDPTPSLTEDANASFGTIEQTSYGYQGSTARLWKIVNDNGNETKEQVNSSTYRMTSDVYTVGTKTDNAAARAEMQAAIAANDLAKAKEVAAKYSQSSSSSSSSEKKEDSSDDSDSDGTEKTDDSSDTEKTEDDED